MKLIDLVRLAPGHHQRFTAEAAVGTQQDAGSRPAKTDLCNDPLDLLARSCRPVDVRAPQLGCQQVPAAEDVERQVAIAVVVTVEEAALVMAVDRIIGRVEIKDDLLRRLFCAFPKTASRTDPRSPRGHG